MNDLCTKSANELATLIRTRKLTSTEVIEAHLARIAEVNPAVNAVTTPLADTARAAAAQVDHAVAAGSPLGPLAGVPFTVKENIDVAGSATTWGVAQLAGQLASDDAPVVARLREAGAIPLARTNLPDFAFRWDTDSGRAGRTRNPWDPTRTAGGSSGGEAVALSTGMTPLGLGNDLGGSLRIPAQMCGIAALRPTQGRIADAACTEPMVPPSSIQVINSQGPMARRIADLRIAFQLLSAPDARDPRWVPAPLQGPPLKRPIRVAVLRDPGNAGIDPQVRAGVDRAATWLADAGYDVVDAEPPMLAEAAAIWFDLVGADLAGLWPMVQQFGGPGHQFMGNLLTKGAMKFTDPKTHAGAWMTRHRVAAAWSKFATDHSILLSPICCEPAWTIGDDLTRIEELGVAMRMVVAVNALGLPACAVPVGADAGLPQAVQLIGGRFREDLLLDAGQALEDRAPRLGPIDPRSARASG